MDKPGRHNKRWKQEEDTELLKELKEGISLKEICKIHERTLGSINSRIEKHAVEMFDKKMDIKQIELITRLKNVEQVVNEYKIRENKRKELREMKKDEKKQVLIKNVPLGQD